jgi:hypothetical protein
LKLFKVEAWDGNAACVHHTPVPLPLQAPEQTSHLPRAEPQLLGRPPLCDVSLLDPVQHLQPVPFFRCEQ